MSFVLVGAFAGVAFAYKESTPKDLPSSGTLNGCVRRFQSVIHGGSNDPVNISLDVVPMNSGCVNPLAGGDVSGTAKIGLAKLDSNGQVSQLCTAETFTFKQQSIASKTFTYPKPPCGPGDYLAFSCSEVLNERQVTPVGRLFAILVGQTQSDCGSYLTWTWSPAGPHPIHD